VSGALALCLAVVAGACGDSADGRSLRTPAPHQTTTTGAATAGVEAGSAGNGSSAGADAAIVQPLTLSSSAVTDGGELPARYTCRGEDVSPPLLWTGVPAGTAELAVVVRDVDAEGFVHWVVAGMPANVGGIAEATAPGGAVEAANDFGRPGWAGPCPPSGTHHYEIRVYALAQPSGVAAGEDGAGAAAKIEAAPALASAILGASSTAG
jgi:Raf kinase inhibitor-like YbhB/YbcL family protein